jgi:hypothetical protein
MNRFLLIHVDGTAIYNAKKTNFELSDICSGIASVTPCDYEVETAELDHDNDVRYYQT